jgi:MFS family permease
VLLSGFTALVYEVVWARRLALVLGSATSAASAVLSAFMFGLAAGALLVGWRADASRRPLRWYGVLEIGIGVYALAFDSLLDLAGGLFASQPWLCAFALLSLPAALMGGTLPVLARAASDTTQLGTRAFGSLYGVNTLGAVLGALLAGVVLLEALGLSGATRLAAVLNIVLGVCFWAAAMAAGDRSVYAADEEAPPPRPLGDAEPSILLAFFLAGFAALGLEMAWFRLLVYFLEGFTVAFGLMLAAYLLGLGAGALGGTTLALLAKNPRRLLARILLVEAVLALATFLLVTPLGDSLEAMREGYKLKDAIDSAYAMKLFWTTLVVVLPATFCAGMLMPVVARITLADRESIGLHTGVVYAVSTFGAVLAPPVVAFWLLPARGRERRSRPSGRSCCSREPLSRSPAACASGRSPAAPPWPSSSCASPPGSGRRSSSAPTCSGRRSPAGSCTRIRARCATLRSSRRCPTRPAASTSTGSAPRRRGRTTPTCGCRGTSRCSCTRPRSGSS